MKKDLLDILRCPECKGELDLTSTEGSVEENTSHEIEEGTLQCKNCGIKYPIEDGIPNMLPPEN
ncbi:MAG: methytransferase partner Trm112 [Candidatus Thermoplasmatota archaeon]|nr:methytransferase partner Trm112 [Candidatus Thermoplasmatota archaeon]MBS3790578.1 methytransferase partner Trm112 [Candidatus Thermoplasmatota archaeon]